MPDTNTGATPLPRGRHKLGAEEVRASQRARLLQAMEDLVDEVGYSKASVPKVARRARVTDRAFYALFSDKAECFIALCEQHGDALREELSDAAREMSGAEDMFAAFDAGLHRYLRWWMERPGGSRAFFVEILTVGDRAYASRDSRAALFAQTLRGIGTLLRARAGIDGAPAEIDATAAAAVATELVAREVRAGRIDHLPEIHADLRRVLLLLLLGREM